MLITGDTSLAENTSINLHLKFQHRRVWSVAGISRRSDVVCSREKETGLIDASWWLPGGGKQANSTRSKVTIPPVERGSCQRGIAFHLILMKNHRVFHNKYSPLTLFAISRSCCCNRRIDALYIANKQTGHGNDFSSSFIRSEKKRRRTYRMKRDEKTVCCALLKFRAMH